jgi:hypothetical protein
MSSKTQQFIIRSRGQDNTLTLTTAKIHFDGVSVSMKRQGEVAVIDASDPDVEIEIVIRAKRNPGSKKRSADVTDGSDPKRLRANVAIPQDITPSHITEEQSQRIQAECAAPESWMQRFHELLEYKREFGNCDVPCDYKPNAPLGHWVHNQRKFFRKGTLSEERIAALSGIGLVLERHRDMAAWGKRYNELVQYKQQHGDCLVPCGHENKLLRAWVRQQRDLYGKNKITEERVAMLNQLEFSWEKEEQVDREAAWTTRYNELVNYKQQHGNFDVPQHSETNPTLWKWCYSQRTMYKEQKLPEDRIAKLNEINFPWGKPRVDQDTQWTTRYNELAEYRAKFGDCKVPRKYEEHPKLVNWIRRQRKLLKEGKLSAERVAKLNEIGFDWGDFDFQKAFMSQFGKPADSGSVEV